MGSSLRKIIPIIVLVLSMSTLPVAHAASTITQTVYFSSLGTGAHLCGQFPIGVFDWGSCLDPTNPWEAITPPPGGVAQQSEVAVTQSGSGIVTFLQPHQYLLSFDAYNEDQTHDATMSFVCYLNNQVNNALGGFVTHHSTVHFTGSIGPCDFIAIHESGQILDSTVLEFDHMVTRYLIPSAVLVGNAAEPTGTDYIGNPGDHGTYGGTTFTATGTGTADQMWVFVDSTACTNSQTPCNHWVTQFTFAIYDSNTNLVDYCVVGVNPTPSKQWAGCVLTGNKTITANSTYTLIIWGPGQSYQWLAGYGIQGTGSTYYNDDFLPPTSYTPPSSLSDPDSDLLTHPVGLACMYVVSP